MKHPQAAELMAIAQDMDTPMQVYNSCSKWVNCKIDTALWLIYQGNGAAIRIKPKTIMIGDVEVPEPMRVAPEKGTPYWYVSAETFMTFSWDGMTSEVGWLKRGALQATEEGARAMHAALVKQLGGGHKEELAHLSQAFDTAVDKVGAAALAKDLVSQKPSTSREALIKELRMIGLRANGQFSDIENRAADMLEADAQPRQVTCQIYGHVVGACVECNTHIEAQQVVVPDGEGWHGHKFKEVTRGIWRCDCGKQLTDGENKCTNGTPLQSQPLTAEDTQTHADTYPEREAHALSIPEVVSHEAQQAHNIKESYMELREMLELAALAAGYNIGFFSARNQSGFTCGFTHAKDGGGWNPLDNDGDALRLMVVLRLDILWAEHERSVVVCNDSSNDAPVTEKVRFTADPLAATRMAVLRCAAEIGKSMKEKSE